MEARLAKAIILLAAVASLGASHRTANFIVEAPTVEFAKEVGEAAESFRRDLAIEWLGKPMPNWSQPCPILVQPGERLGAGGETSFVFDRGQVFDWRMRVQGSPQRILDSVLPHEVTHTIFATHFRQPLPRWADEGACTTVEHPEEKAKQQRMLIEFLQTNRGIAFSRMFAMRDYPADVMPLYSQGFSLARYLINHGGKRKYVDYIGEGLKSNNWTATTKRFYGFNDLASLQSSWLAWVKEGSPDFNANQIAGGNPAVEDVAAAESPVVRFQSPETASTESQRTAGDRQANTGNMSNLHSASLVGSSIYHQRERGASLEVKPAAHETEAALPTPVSEAPAAPEAAPPDRRPAPVRTAAWQPLLEWKR